MRRKNERKEEWQRARKKLKTKSTKQKSILKNFIFFPTKELTTKQTNEQINILKQTQTNK